MRDFGHGGNIYYYSKVLGCEPEEILDLSSNIWPLRDDEFCVEAKLISRLPSVHGERIKDKVSKKFELPEKNILMGCGTSEIIKSVCNANMGKKVLIFAPTYSDYEKYSLLYNLKTDFFVANEEDDFRCNIAEISFNNYDVVFICNPNNPTGVLIDKLNLLEAIYRHKDTIFVIDESYVEFSTCSDNVSLLGEKPKNLLVLRSFSKSFGLAGLRVGFAYSFNDKMLEILSPYLLEWGIGTVAEDLLCHLIDSDTGLDEFYEAKNFLYKGLQEVENIKVFFSEASFFLIKLLKYNGEYLFEKLLEEKILIRRCNNFRGLSDNFIRVSVKRKESTDRFLKIFKGLME